MWGPESFSVPPAKKPPTALMVSWPRLALGDESAKPGEAQIQEASVLLKPVDLLLVQAWH